MKIDPQRRRAWLLGAVGVLLFLALWQCIGIERWAGLTWQPLSVILPYLLAPAHHRLFVRAIGASFLMIGLGYLAGLASGMVLAMVAHVVRPLRPGLDRLAGMLHAVPTIALAPVFIALLSREWTGMAIAALGTFYVIYVSATSGLAAGTAAHRDMFTVFGSSRLTTLRRLDLPAAMPAVAGGMKFAVPVAFVGAILGEWFGSSHGLGLLIVSAMQNFQIPLLWSTVLIISAASLGGFGLMSLAERFVIERYR